jgi:hypothetical protein
MAVLQDHKPGRDTSADLHRLADPESRSGGFAPLDKLKGGRHGAFGSVLRGFGIPEEGATAISDDPVQVTTLMADRRRGLRVNDPLRLREVFGIQLMQVAG